MVPREGFAEEAWMAGRSSHGNIWGRSCSSSGLASEQPGSAVWGLEKDLGGWRMNRWGSSKKMRLRRFGIARSFGDVWASLLAQMVKGSACNTGDPGSIPRPGKIPGDGNGSPLQYSCLENSTDRGGWWATVCGGGKELDTTEQLTRSFWGHAGHMQSLDFIPTEWEVSEGPIGKWCILA